LLCLLGQGSEGSSAPLARKRSGGNNIVRMTQPKVVSSHDWHVQLCCQRSWLFSPKRTVLDQGPTLGKAAGLCPRTWLRCVVLGRYRECFFIHRPRCSVLRELSKSIEVSLACQPLFSRFSCRFHSSHQNPSGRGEQSDQILRWSTNNSTNYQNTVTTR